MSPEAIKTPEQISKPDVYDAWTKGAFKNPLQENDQRPPVELKSFEEVLKIASDRAITITVSLAFLRDPKTEKLREGTQITVDCGSETCFYQEAYMPEHPEHRSISALLRRDSRVEELREAFGDATKIIYEADEYADPFWQRLLAKRHKEAFPMAKIILPTQFPLKTVRKLQNPSAMPA